MQNLMVWQKLMLIGVIFMLPFAGVTYKMTSSIYTLGIDFAEQEARGLEYYTPAVALLKDLQQHRGMTAAWLAGDASFKAPIEAKAGEVRADIAAIDEVEGRLAGALQTAEKWAPLAAACRELLNPPLRTTDAATNFAKHTQVIEDTIALIAAVGDASNLTLDPDIDSYYLMNLLVFQGPELSEMLAQARGRGAALVAGGKRTPDALAALTRATTLVEFLQAKVDDSVNKALEFNPALKSSLEAKSRASAAAVGQAATESAALVAAGLSAQEAAPYYASLTRGVDSVFDLETAATQALSGLIAVRIDKFQREIIFTLVWAGAGLLIVCVIGFFLMVDVTSSLGRVVAIANRIATGDLTVDLASERRRDEIGVLARAFEQMVGGLKEKVLVAERIAAGDLAVTVTKRSEQDAMGHALANMVERLSALMGDVQRSGIQVNTSVNEIAATAKQQQATASEIAATTTEIGATSKQITATSRELVRTMNEVSTVAEDTATLAGNGQAGLTRMEESMSQVMAAAGSINAKLAVLNEKAGNITHVVTTITKVADQTNLLSLNAAIEAEKAGEYGRGFAVVATEIRRLADQTAVATYDIEQMVKEIQSAVSAGVMGMDKFSEEVRRGMNEVQQVGGQLSSIIQQVQALAPRCESVNEGMQAQATGAEQITQALSQLSDAAQQTVDSLLQSSQVIDRLNLAANGMRNGALRFKVAA